MERKEEQPLVADENTERRVLQMNVRSHHTVNPFTLNGIIQHLDVVQRNKEFSL